jgi:hypothetical protein
MDPDAAASAAGNTLQWALFCIKSVTRNHGDVYEYSYFLNMNVCSFKRSLDVADISE